MSCFRLPRNYASESVKPLFSSSHSKNTSTPPISAPSSPIPMSSSTFAVATDSTHPVPAIVTATTTEEKCTDDVGFHLSNIPLWTKWALVSIISYAIPFYNTVLRIEDKIEDVVEVLAEDVEKAAVVVEKVAAEIADVLPEDSIVENDFVMIENIAEEVIKEADEVEAFIKKVDDIKEEIEEKVEPYIEKWEEENKSM